MVKRETENKTELTETEKEMLHEMIVTYQSMKIMSRMMKWLVFFIFILILDFARLIDTIEDIFVHLKRWFSKN
ncbi:hypothetical protein [Bartonella sp. CB169]|uniref:hypothetical protein n=1 Tax=Bartonella sp. CB169 TaxID=3112257 RepID=UPI00300DF9B0